MARRPTLILLCLLLGASACRERGAATVELAVAGEALPMGARLVPEKLRTTWMPADWALTAWLKKDGAQARRGWVLVCPLQAGEAVGLDCLRPPPDGAGRGQARKLEGAERVWPGQGVALVGCGRDPEPGCTWLGESLVLERPSGEGGGDAGTLVLSLSPEQQALLGPRLFALSLPPEGAAGAGNPGVAVGDLLDVDRLRLLHHQRLGLMEETLRDWGRALPETAEAAP